jgi:molybdopterin-guanine dinucleotide biosynthesis protein B
VLVEGFKHADVLKLEIWRASQGKPVQYADDPFVVAIATDAPGQLPVPTHLPVLDLNDAAAVATHLMQTAARYDYISPLFEQGNDADAGPGPGSVAGGGRAAAGD